MGLHCLFSDAPGIVPRLFNSLGTFVFDVLKRHWPEYLMEAAGLMFFMVNAAWITTLLEYPGSPVRRAIDSDFIRRIPLGIAMGLVIAIIIYNPWGKRSGAHINPAVTWSFLRLGKIGRWDAAFYTLFQFLGGVAAAFTMRLLLGAPFRHEKVNYAATTPRGQARGRRSARSAITLLLMLVMLFAMSSKKLELNRKPHPVAAAYRMLLEHLGQITIVPRGEMFEVTDRPATLKVEV